MQGTRASRPRSKLPTPFVVAMAIMAAALLAACTGSPPAPNQDAQLTRLLVERDRFGTYPPDGTITSYEMADGQLTLSTHEYLEGYTRQDLDSRTVGLILDLLDKVATENGIAVANRTL